MQYTVPIITLDQPLFTIAKSTWVTRTQRAHLITASSLCHLLRKAYLVYCNSLWEERNQLSLFKFCLLILQLDMAVLVHVRATRKGDFKLYLDALTKIVPWFFVSDHTNYTQWIPVHLRDLVTLKDVHSKVFAEVSERKFRGQEDSTQILCYCHWLSPWAEQCCSEIWRRCSRPHWEPWCSEALNGFGAGDG